jgi:hypothetical protein
MSECDYFVVASHLRLDLTPALTAGGFPQPGKLTKAGPPHMSPGRAVSNAGLGQATSYSIVIAPESCDRAFLHCAGTNAGFTSMHVRDQSLDGAIWLHFGYPPLMPAVADNGGKERASLFCRARAHGLRTLLDFCSISPDSASIDLREVLRNRVKFVTALRSLRTWFTWL